VLVYLVSLGAGLKKRVVRPMSNSLGERITRDQFLVGVEMQSCSALILHVRPIAKAHKGSGATEGLLRREGEHFLGGTGMWGMRDCRLLV
jgi:hypothetical protein